MNSIIFRSGRRDFGIFLSFQRRKSIRIGCASGFWGDTAVSTPQLLHGTPKIDYIVYDYLSEITMSLLARMKAKDPKLGYCPDFVAFHMAPHIKDIKEKGVKIIANAGGLNPAACAEALRTVAKSKGVENLRIGVIDGDDILAEKEKYLQTGWLERSSDKSALSAKRRWASMNVYFGAGPIAKALDLGADIVITGRCTDSSIVLGPLTHEFKWKADEWDKLATGSVAGHLIECGAQVTGGIFTDWESTAKTWPNIGFPIVEFDSDHPTSFVVTKPAGTGGRVSFGTVAEQLVYESGDPKRYILPDVVVDMSNISIEELHDSEKSGGKVKVSGAKGSPAMDHYKVSSVFVFLSFPFLISLLPFSVSATVHDGFRCTAVCPVIGPMAEKKARATAKAILTRCEAIFKKLGLPGFIQTNVHVIGTEDSYGARASASKNVRECVLWLAVEHSNKDALGLFAREIAPAGTGMAPGLTTIVGGRPNVSPVLRLCNFLTSKDIEAKISVDGCDQATYMAPPGAKTILDGQDVHHEKKSWSSSKAAAVGGASGRKLSEIAFARSGDKGDSANIGVICRDKRHFPILREVLTEDVVRDYFRHFLNESSTVKRYELPGIGAFNFLLTNSLGGGGIASLRVDPQGKAYAQMLLDLDINDDRLAS